MASTKYTFLAHHGAGSPLNPNLRPGVTNLRLDAILLRESSSRGLDPAHVISLAESISTLGLLEPIVIDQTGRLLAGNHRLAALKILASRDPEKRKHGFARRVGFSGSKLPTTGKLGKWLERVGDLVPGKISPHAIPVQVIALSSDNEKMNALAIESAENNVRRKYSKAEIQALVKRCRDAGYVETMGRPKGGKKTVMSALEAALGLSKRQIQRILSDEESTRAPKTPLENAQKALEKVVKHLDEIGRNKRTDEAKNLIKKAEAVLAKREDSTIDKPCGMLPDPSHQSTKIRASMLGINKGILPLLKAMRVQCEQKAAKEFPVDTTDYFTVVDHITKRLLPLITRLEAEIAAV